MLFISALLSGYEVDKEQSKIDFAVYLLSKAKFEFYKDGVWYLNNDKYYTSVLGKMMQNILKLKGIKNSKEYEKLLYDSLDNIKYEVQLKQSGAPATARVFLMLK